ALRAGNGEGFLESVPQKTNGPPRGAVCLALRDFAGSDQFALLPLAPPRGDCDAGETCPQKCHRKRLGSGRYGAPCEGGRARYPVERVGTALTQRSDVLLEGSQTCVH